MSLTYDFDIHEIIPQELGSNPAIAELLQSTGIDLSARGNHMALFRDPATAKALQGASETVRSYFEASGFGFKTTFDSGAGPSRFPAKDGQAMTEIVARLKENYSKFELKGEDWNGFSFKEFIAHIKTMKPVAEPGPKAEAQKAAKTNQGAGADGMTPLERVRVKEEERQAALMAQLGIDPALVGAPGVQAAMVADPTLKPEAPTAAAPMAAPALDPNVGIPSAAINAAQVSKTYGRASRAATAMLACLVLTGVGLAYLAIQFAPVPDETETAQAAAAPSIGDRWREQMIQNLFPGRDVPEEEQEPEKIVPRVVYR
ncbi:MAG: hypothetical protein AAGA87_15685 [Pseudomonadota bacterium]